MYISISIDTMIMILPLIIIVVIFLVFINAIRCNECFFNIHRLSRCPEGILRFLVHHLYPIYNGGVNKHLF